ncbi:MAG: TadE/TadG family type IV pilus assembly protein [Rubripirellula sp.]
MARTISSRKCHRRTGAAALEFAVAITVLLAVVFASIEFVRLNMLMHSVEHASYLGARRGIIMGAKADDVKTAAKAHLSLMQLNGATVTVSPGTIKDDTELVEVLVEVPVSGNSWISPVYFAGSLTGRTRMLAERASAEMANSIGGS